MTAEHSSNAGGVPLAGTGIEGLDDILAGGFTRGRLYLIEGVPGSGKTTLALQFLLEGARRGESVLYVTLSETVDELASVISAHGWSADGMAIRELAPSESNLLPDETYTMFHPSEVELSETTKKVLADVERLSPARVVFDSLSELRLLAGNPLRYRRQILALKQFFNGRNCTVLVLDDMTSSTNDLQVQSIAHGVVRLEQVYPEYGAERRRLIVLKYRGVRFRGGFHDFRIKRGGLEVYPRLVAAEHRTSASFDRIASGIPEFDQLIGGGIERGSSTLIIGAAGTGKSSLASQLVSAAADNGLRAAMFIFDESLPMLLSRATGLGINLPKHVESGQVAVRQIDPAELSPGEMVFSIRQAVEKEQAAIVVLDSLNGYLNAMPEERFLMIQLHELLMYLGQAGVATILIGAHQGLIGANMTSPVDTSYLADAVILMRYFENGGQIRQAISVIKKRGGAHERTIREFKLDAGRIGVGPALTNFRGILTGVPVQEHRGDPARPASVS
jgi:circadian clock protein KaiC